MANDYKRRTVKESRAAIKGLSTEKLKEAKRLIEDILTYRAVTKLKSTYVDGVSKALEVTNNGKVYYDLKIDGTVTGRLSCSKYADMGVSFHTLARASKWANIRRMFIPERKDHAFITSDYSGMELRMAAYLSGDERMIQAFKDGKDLHTFTASLLIVTGKHAADVSPFGCSGQGME